jgi:hypothetical protein
MSPSVAAFLGGLTAMLFIVIGVYFVKFWHRTRDPLFIAFAIAFWLLALNQSLLAMNVVPSEERGWTYLLRVAAFLFIAIAIVRKNSERK